MGYRANESETPEFPAREQMRIALAKVSQAKCGEQTSDSRCRDLIVTIEDSTGAHCVIPHRPGDNSEFCLLGNPSNARGKIPGTPAAQLSRDIRADDPTSVHCAGRWSAETGEQRRERGLAGTTCPHDCH